MKGSVCLQGQAVAVWDVLMLWDRAVGLQKLNGLWSWRLPTTNWGPKQT